MCLATSPVLFIKPTPISNTRLRVRRGYKNMSRILKVHHFQNSRAVKSGLYLFAFPILCHRPEKHNVVLCSLWKPCEYSYTRDYRQSMHYAIYFYLTLQLINYLFIYFPSHGWPTPPHRRLQVPFIYIKLCICGIL